MSKTKMRELLPTVAGIVCSTALLYYILKEQSDGILLAPREEHQLEERLDRPIYFRKLDFTGRVQKVKLLGQVYDRTSQNWDHFERQFKKVRGIRFPPYYSIARDDSDTLTTIASINISRELVIYSPEKFDDAALIHELGHYWYFSLPQGTRAELEEHWNRNGTYFTAPSLPTLEEALRSTSAISIYGSTSLEDDIAETCRFVYLIQSRGLAVLSDRHRLNFTAFLQPALTAVNFPEVVRKIGLLQVYGFISKREEGLVMGKLRSYQQLMRSEGIWNKNDH